MTLVPAPVRYTRPVVMRDGDQLHTELQYRMSATGMVALYKRIWIERTNGETEDVAFEPIREDPQ